MTAFEVQCLMKAERKVQGLTQREITERVGVTSPALCGLEEHRRGGLYETIRLVLDVLGYDIVLRRRADGEIIG